MKLFLILKFRFSAFCAPPCKMFEKWQQRGPPSNARHHVFGGLATWVSYPSNSVESALVAACVNQDLFWEKEENPCTHENPGINKQRHDFLWNLAVDFWLQRTAPFLSQFWAKHSPSRAQRGAQRSVPLTWKYNEVHRVYNGRKWENQWKSAINGYKWGHLLGDISTMWCMDVSENGNVASNWWQVQYGTWW